MIKYRSQKERREVNSPNFCPVLFRKVHLYADVLEREYGIDFLITSTGRADMSSHDKRNCIQPRIRALDGRVRDPRTMKRVSPVKVSKAMKVYHDTRLRKYGRFDSCIEHNVGRGPHIHMQTPKKFSIISQIGGNNGLT